MTTLVKLLSTRWSIKINKNSLFSDNCIWFDSSYKINAIIVNSGCIDLRIKRDTRGDWNKFKDITHPLLANLKDNLQ